MNGAIVTRVSGSAPVGGGFVAWQNVDESTSEFIRCGGGFYWLLANVTLLDHATLADTETIEWNAGLLTPRSMQFYTRAHTHFGNVNGSTFQSTTGPRLIFQNPLQLWSYGQLAPGQQIKLNITHAADVELIAIRQSVIAHTESLGLELR